MAASGVAYDDGAPAGPRMRQHEQRISNLERGLAVLETIVERMAASMNDEHQAMKENRQEDRAAMRRLGEQMEQSFTILSEKMEKIVEKNTATDKDQSRAKGVVAGASWAGNVLIAVAGLLLTASSLVIAYQAGERNSAPEYNTPTQEARPAR